MRGPFFQPGFFQGHALSEYGLIGAVILAGSLGVLVMVAGGLGNGMTDLKADLQGNVTSAQQAKPSVLPPSLQDAAAKLPPPGAGETPVCFEGGLCLNMPYIQGGVSNTAGGLGSDEAEALAKLIEQVARQLEAQGADPGLVAKITALANRGHGVSQSLKVTAQDYRTKADYYQANLNYPGLNFGNDFNLSMTNNQAYISSQTQDFQKAWGEVRSAIAKVPPSPALATAKAIIDVQAREIINISGSVSQDNIDYAQLMADPDIDMMASLTRQDANTICQTGGNVGQCYVNPGSGWQTP